jgi:hypothetical protein
MVLHTKCRIMKVTDQAEPRRTVNLINLTASPPLAAPSCWR